MPAPYPNYRVSVSIVLKDDDKILLMKREPGAMVAPGAWCLPAGKVKYDEIPPVGAVRECLEETGIPAEIVRELSCRAFKIKSGDEEAYRLGYTYLMRPLVKEVQPKVVMNDEHTEFTWITCEELQKEMYDLLPEQKEILLLHAFK